MKRKARECGIEQGDRNKKAAKKVACWVQLIRLSERTKQKNGGWQRPTLPRSHPRSTIGARALNCRVRDGAGWTRTALATNTPSCRSLRSEGVMSTSVMSHE
jgi:hypothetical protein